MDPSTLSYLIAALLVLVGLAGTVLPVLPGVPLVFAGLLLAAWTGDFAQVGWPTLAVLAGLTLVSIGVDLWATAHGAKRVGASRQAMLGAAIGTFGGLFLGLPGLLLGPFAGAVIGELLHHRALTHRTVGHATKVGAGTWLGLLLGTALKLALAFAMLGLFALAWWL
ncbi:DUF456 domain-containing protein [Thermomonas sp.]|uniref:DUF456 domain-containing protein n=1 Tax=Thermomonas sp. TaxID=1971895 RepID=UPI0035B3B205